MDEPLKYARNGQCHARPTVTFPAAGHHRRWTGTKLYCSVTEAHACEQLAQGCCLKARGRELNQRPSESQVAHPNRYAASANLNRSKCCLRAVDFCRTEEACITDGIHVPSMWPGGIVVGALDLRLKRSRIRVSAVPLSGNNLGQVIHTHAPLSPSGIICYRSRGGDALRLGR